MGAGAIVFPMRKRNFSKEQLRSSAMNALDGLPLVKLERKRIPTFPIEDTH